jgi:hypothetical protein
VTPDPTDGDRVAMRGTLVDAASPTGREFVLELRFGDSRAAVPDVAGPDGVGPDGVGPDGVGTAAFEIAVHDTVGTARVQVMRQRFTRSADNGLEREPAKGRDDGK